MKEAFTIGMVLFGLGVAWLSHNLGADLFTVLWAAVPTAVLSALALWAWYSIQPQVSVVTLISGLSAALYPFWWRVFDSIVSGGGAPDEFMLQFYDRPFWASTWFEWGLEVFFVVAFICFASRDWKRSTGYFY